MQPSKTVSSPSRIALATLASVGLADFLFYRQPPGWTLGLYALLLLGGIIWIDGVAWLPSRRGIGLAMGLVGLVVALIIRPNLFALILILAALISAGAVARCGWIPDAWGWVTGWLRFVTTGWSCLFRDLQSWRTEPSGAGANRWKTAAGTLIRFTPIAVLALVFIALFAIANPVIERGVNRLIDGLHAVWDWVRFPAFDRIGFWGLTAVYAWALLRYRIATRMIAGTEPDPDPDPIRAGMALVTPQTIVVALALFNLIFAIQNLLDIGYLWGGITLPQGMTYAAYAHRGAYPLIVTALLAAAFVLTAFQPTTDSAHGRLSRGLVYLWIAQNVFLTASAGWRLNLYVAVYSLTRLRVAAALWMLLVAMGLIWICVRIVTRRSNTWLINVNAITLVGWLYVCAFANIPGYIARYNTRHCHEVSGFGAWLDFDYLHSLGPEAIPALQWLQRETDADPALSARIDTEIKRLETQLAVDMRNWRGWTWRRHQLARAVGK